MLKNNQNTCMAHVAAKQACAGNLVAIGIAVVYLSRPAHALVQELNPGTVHNDLPLRVIESRLGITLKSIFIRWTTVRK